MDTHTRTNDKVILLIEVGVSHLEGFHMRKKMQASLGNVVTQAEVKTNAGNVIPLIIGQKKRPKDTEAVSKDTII